MTRERKIHFDGNGYIECKQTGKELAVTTIFEDVTCATCRGLVDHSRIEVYISGSESPQSNLPIKPSMVSVGYTVDRWPEEFVSYNEGDARMVSEQYIAPVRKPKLSRKQKRALWPDWSHGMTFLELRKKHKLARVCLGGYYINSASNLEFEMGSLAHVGFQNEELEAYIPSKG